MENMEEVGKLSEALPIPDVLTYHIEVCQKSCSTALPNTIREYVHQFLTCVGISYGDATFTQFEDDFLMEHVKTITVTDTELVMRDKKAIDLQNCKLAIHVFQLHEDGPASEELEEEISAANHWLLPSAEFDGLWDSLVFDSDVKAQLINYASTTLLFSDRGVCSNIITWNRVVLLHGPPGTGKTSLCQALAQKLSIRLSDRYTYGQLIEINSHSLFSKWFSESGKLVMKMFQKIQELIDDRDALVCVLIDEVESLTAARKAAMQGQEPSDAIRVVNALLTQIDQIKRYPNVLILTTSNVTGAIDLAFVDRADIKHYIGPPSVNACYKIYHSCINELMRTGIISPAQQIIDLRGLEVLRFVHNDATHLSLELKEIAKKRKEAIRLSFTLQNATSSCVYDITALPTHWDPMDDKTGYVLNELPSASQEYTNVKKSFMKTVTSHTCVKKIERVQNPDLWTAFVQKKGRMTKKANDVPPKEMSQLFHGTTADVVDAICQQGFDWRMCGKHGTLYGKGSYFARDASYSHGYTNHIGLLRDRKMLVARVLVGSSVLGASSLTRPPPKDPLKPNGDLHDSCVDNTVHPSIYVVFDNNQCYPEYLITYN